ncbi:MAG: ABC transporter ATP-binding protein [Nitrososphaerota archaeon]|jgi:iron complex transport system ATP-binding protein|uniref:ABC transporter ATP-binding protein n=1 Tax=Candidatus Bathycorpusculum sp. TaxID=2994959 RepID=UPI002829FAF1|nr:ABC transporter ATP-binding protein [Candidatus Termiticorpusculum sp.]MCL2257039.1 ABC transporter ATP-binding protein [Candidatus Termiticorpusculum sp.]MCL2292835.1 ABC transporter ATP-binding protein [Candidatus Termiticorpusculum sp.]MDR0461390.1 ABC transporter ATP-binding protein [Nitrososphaerota archaeon]
MVELKVDNIDCYYDSIKIIESISLQTQTGQFLGILGPNGSGKTTLLKSISHILKPKVGTILLNDQDLYTLKANDVAKQMAVVSQGSNVAFSFTALDVVLMGRSPHLSRFAVESEKDVDIAKKAMAYTGTLHLQDRLITELSGGERQRIIISRALAQEPQVLLLDEPTTFLDVANQLEIMDLLKQLCDDKKLLVVGVFHDFNLAARYCDSLILLKKGKIVATGKSDVLTSENIKTIFNIDTVVKQNSITKTPYIIPISINHKAPKRSLTIHIICGSGSGSSLMKQLIDDGYNVTAGVLNLFDTDQETASFLKIPIVAEAPMSPISEVAHNDNLCLITKADFVIVTSFPYGYGNIKNIDAALFAVGQGIPTLLLDESPIDLRDYTKGQAKEKMQVLKNKGAVVVKDEITLLSALNYLTQKHDSNNQTFSSQSVTSEIVSLKEVSF